MTVFENVSQSKEEKKPTVFTHALYLDGAWRPAQTSPDAYNRVVYLGEYGDGYSVFAAYFADALVIFKGTKGDEF